MISKEALDRKVFFIHGAVDGEERNEVRAIVEKETNAIIIASEGTFSTGINIKNLHNGIKSASSKGRIRNLQSIGRGLRLGSDKSEFNWFDIADDLKYKGNINTTLSHLLERVAIYNKEKFEYKTYKVGLK
jgi:superfamily II DNA or RNA helicase